MAASLSRGEPARSCSMTLSTCSSTASPSIRSSSSASTLQAPLASCLTARRAEGAICSVARATESIIPWPPMAPRPSAQFSASTMTSSRPCASTSSTLGSCFRTACSAPMVRELLCCPAKLPADRCTSRSPGSESKMRSTGTRPSAGAKMSAWGLRLGPRRRGGDSLSTRRTDACCRYLALPLASIDNTAVAGQPCKAPRLLHGLEESEPSFRGFMDSGGLGMPGPTLPPATSFSCAGRARGWQSRTYGACFQPKSGTVPPRIVSWSSSGGRKRTWPLQRS
mmetsp:Transcript_24683/g.77644  ORF Transcript_24683/g.77644 Transcript_24683/m.77644 type:complete len:281 (+) Transcript_24683:269-1111(+)